MTGLHTDLAGTWNLLVDFRQVSSKHRESDTEQWIEKEKNGKVYSWFPI